MSIWERALLGGGALALLAGACTVDNRPLDVAERYNGPASAGASSGGSGQGGSPAPPTPAEPDSMEETGAGGAAGLNAGEAGGAGGSAIANLAGAAGSGLGAAGSEMAAGGSAGTTSTQPTLGTGLALAPLNGWVDGRTNGVGIQGPFLTSSDRTLGGPSTISPADFGSSGSDICVQGTVGPVGPIGVDDGTPDYAGDWGVLVGFNLAVAAPGGAVTPWSRVTGEGTVAGFSFALNGQSIPRQVMYFYAVGEDGRQYCINLAGTSSAAQSVLFSQLVTECYSPGSGQALPANVALTGLQWTIAATVDSAVPYDFCISDLRAVVN